MSWKAIDRYSKDYIEIQAKDKVRVYRTPNTVLQEQLKVWDQTIAKKSAAARPLGLWAGFVDIQRSAIEICPVQCGDGLLALPVVAHLDESEAPGLACIAIRDNVDAPNVAVSFKQRTDGILRRSKIEISHKNVFHNSSGPF